MKLYFLGTGGGRINLAKQFRSTAGFMIGGSKNVYVDPGPGVIYQARRFRVKLHKIDILFVSHSHLDHANDANLLIEAMTYATLRKRGILIADRISLHGSSLGERILAPFNNIIADLLPMEKIKSYEPAITEYHRGIVNAVYEISPGKEIEMEEVRLIGTKTKHDAPAVGFILEMDGKRIGYTADTEYFEDLPHLFAGCDAIVINMLRASKPDFPGHLYPETVTKFLKLAQPKKAFITRFGGQFIKVNANIIAKKIQDESGIPTIATRDGLVVEI